MIEIGAKFPIGGDYPPVRTVTRKDASTDAVDDAVLRQDVAVTTRSDKDEALPLVDGKLSLPRVAELLDRFVPQELPNTRLQIEHDENTGLFVYKSVNAESGEIVRQYPAEEILRFISFYREREGILVDDRV
ncbi:MAG: hypothetical protein DCC73_04205 [Proteobacteria bacterium]|jgi:uncharacterized FlaG/YvyC family protein|nr:MAG: hypothetical protein DCC73_04205 [Pseudomonadota bacterium]